jgi:SpoVK/Ycf46/Vps4 family AAA+-type ATPase
MSLFLLQVKWDDVGGLEEVKQRLKEAVEWPFKNPEALARLGAQAPKGMLGFWKSVMGQCLSIPLLQP